MCRYVSIYMFIYIYPGVYIGGRAVGAVSDISSAGRGELVRWMRRAGLSYSLSRVVMDGDAEQASRSSRYPQSRASRRQRESGSRCSRSKGGFWRGRAKVRTAGSGATQSNAAVVAPGQGGHESSRVDSSARHHGGSSEASEGEATAQAEDRSRRENGGRENGNELEMGSGREGGQNAWRSRYQGLATPKEPPMVP
jgi:hypothetical protein